MGDAKEESGIVLPIVVVVVLAFTINQFGQSHPWLSYVAYFFLATTTAHAIWHGLLKRILRFALGVLVIPFQPVLLLLRLRTNARTIHGSASFQSTRKIRRGNLAYRGAEQDGVYLGAYTDWQGRSRPLVNPARSHTLVVGASRSGKGAGIIIPTLLSWKHSVICYDEKAELSERTANWRQSIGGEVFKFEPGNPDSECGFNFLDTVRLGSPYEIADAQNIAHVLVEDEPSGDGQHWAATARELIAATILHCLGRIEGASLATVATALSNPKQAPDELFAEMALSDNAFVAGVGMAQASRADRERSSVTSSALRHLAIFRDPIVAANTASSTFAMSDLADAASPASLFIVTRAVDAHRLKPLVRLMFTQSMLSLMGADLRFDEAGKALPAHRHPVLMVLDEFPSLGRMEILEQSLARCLGYGIAAIIAIQDISQLHRSYGEHENTIANCDVRVCFPTNSYSTARWISDQVGSTTVTTRMRSTSLAADGKPGAGSTSTSEQHTPRQLLLPDEVMRLRKLQRVPDGRDKPGKVLVLEAGQRAVLCDQLLYYADPAMNARAKGEAAATEPFVAGNDNMERAKAVASVAVAVALPLMLLGSLTGLVSRSEVPAEVGARVGGAVDTVSSIAGMVVPNLTPQPAPKQPPAAGSEQAPAAGSFSPIPSPLPTFFAPKPAADPATVAEEKRICAGFGPGVHVKLCEHLANHPSN